MSDSEFRKWVETLPDDSWAKKDLSACRLGWDAALDSLVELLRKKQTSHRGTQRFLYIGQINECIQELAKTNNETTS